MSILITGSEGYIGQSLAKLLREKRNEVLGFDIVNAGVQDLKDIGNISHVFNTNKNIDLVIHLAALAGVEKDFSEYQDYLENNVLGTFNLLEAMRENDIKKILYASSCSCYGSNKNSKEWNESKPESMYGLSKFFGEELVKFYGRNHGFSWNSFRIFNVIGRGGESDFNNKRLIPTLLNNIFLGQDINLFLQSNKKDTPIRDYVDIKFVCEVFNGFIEKQTNKIINIGSGQGISGKDMAEKMFKLFGRNVNIKYSEKRKGDPDKSVSNNERLEKAGFKYNKSIEDIAKE